MHERRSEAPLSREVPTPPRRTPGSGRALVLLLLLAACQGAARPDAPVRFADADARRVQVRGYRYDGEFRRIYVDLTNGSRQRVNKMVITFRAGSDSLRCNAYGDVGPGETGVLAALRMPDVVKTHRPTVEEIDYYPRLAGDK